MARDARVPPHNLQAEESLLGAMLLSRDALMTAAEAVTADDFYKPAHAHVFSACCSLFAEGEPVDAITVADRLGRDGLHEAIGGPSTLISLVANTGATSNAGRYAAIVARNAILRRVIGCAGEIAEMGYDASDEDATTVVDRAEALFFALGDRRRRRQTVQLGESLGAWLDRLEQRWESGELEGVPTGFKDLDALLLGLHPGQLVSIAGRPSMGKSAVAGALAVNIATAGRPALLVSAEMSLEELQDRFMAGAAELGLDFIRRAAFGKNDWPRLSAGIARLADIPLYVDDDPAATLMSIRASARRVAAKAGPLGVVIVDYLQIVTPLGKTENRQTEVAELSRGLKKLAGELHTPVVALAQLNRTLEGRADKRPMLSDLRESGAIENDSDVVVLLYRDEYYKPSTTKDKGVMELIVAKQRNGPHGVVRMGYDAARGTFRDLAPREEW